MKLLLLPFSNKARLVVGVSGGSDSLALLCILQEQLEDLSGRLVAAHVNYGLRGRDSLRDEDRVRQFCGERGVSFRCFRPGQFKERSSRSKRSLQDLAREIRYGYFQKLVHREKAWGVAVAHQKEDQAETILDRLLRGAGSRGLSGLRPVQSLNFSKKSPPLKVWRPLLSYSRAELQGYLKIRRIPWRVDQSNQKTWYRRNQIRHEVLPFLSRWNPRLTEVLARVGEVTAAEDEYLQTLLPAVGKKLNSRWKGTAYSCSAPFFQRLPPALQRRWVRFVSEKLTERARGLSFEHIEEVIRLWEGRESGPRDLGFGLSAGRNKNNGFLRWKG